MCNCPESDVPWLDLCIHQILTPKEIRMMGSAPLQPGSYDEFTGTNYRLDEETGLYVCPAPPA